jgi:hypothetical protein
VLPLSLGLYAVASDQPLLRCWRYCYASPLPPSGFSQPHPYCCWLNPHFDTALFISAATVATPDVSLHSSLPHCSLRSLLWYLCCATSLPRPLCCCLRSAAAALLALLLCLSVATFWLFSAPSLLLLVESAFRYCALHFCCNCRYAGCELALFFAPLLPSTYAVLPMLCYLSSLVLMLLPPLSCCCAAGSTVMPLRCCLLAFLSLILMAAGRIRISIPRSSFLPQLSLRWM